MDDSVIEKLQSEAPSIKRKTKRIQYKKPKVQLHFHLFTIFC